MIADFFYHFNKKQLYANPLQNNKIKQNNYLQAFSK